jgi:hypothetical protein
VKAGSFSLFLREQWRGQISLPCVGKKYHDGFALIFGPFRDFGCRKRRSDRRNTDQQTINLL